MSEGNVGTLTVEIGAKIDGLTDALNEVQRQLAAAAGRAKKAGDELTKVGKSLTRNLTIPLLTLGTAAIKSFSDFDDAMTQSTAIMSNVSEDMRKQMESVARTLSEKTAFAADKLAKAYYFLASAGLTAEQSMKALPAVASFAQAGMFDLETATELLADSQSALGMRSDDAGQNLTNLTRVSDVLTDAANASNASVQQFAEALTNKAAPALRLYGKSVEEGVAVLAAYADQGLKGEAAGEALNIVLRDLQMATNKSGAAWKAAGIEVYDANGKFNNMADIVRQMEKFLGPMSDQQKKVALTTLGLQERSQAYTVTLVGMSDKIADYEERLKKAGGTTKDVADKQLESFKSQMILVKNEITNAAEKIGSALAPALLSIARGVKNIIPDLSGMGDTTKTVSIAMFALAAAIGPTLSLLGKLQAAFHSTRAAMGIVIGGLAFIVERFAIGIDAAGKYTDALDQIADQKKQDRISGFGRIWAQVGAAFDKGAQNIDRSKIALRELDAMAGKLSPTMSALLAPAQAMADAMSAAFNKSKGAAGEAGAALGATSKEIEAALASLGAKSKAVAETELAAIVDSINLLTKAGALSGPKLQEAADKAVDLADSYNLSLSPAIRALGKASGEAYKKIAEDQKKAKDAARKWLEDDLQKYQEKIQRGIDEEKQAKADARAWLEKNRAEFYEKQLEDEKRAQEEIKKSKADARAWLEQDQRDYYEGQAKREQEAKEKTKSMWNEIREIVRDVFTQIESIISQSFENRKAELDNWYEQQKASIEQSLMSEEEKATALENLDKEVAAKKKKLIRDEAVAAKALAMAQAVINIAQGVTRAIAQGGILGIALGAIVAAAGAIQIGLIASQPIPMKEGGLILDGPTVSRDGHFLGGEAGGEIVLPLKKIGEFVAPLIRPMMNAIARPAYAMAGPAMKSMDGAPSGASSSLPPHAAAPIVQVFLGNEQFKDFIAKTVQRRNDLNQLGITRVR